MPAPSFLPVSPREKRINEDPPRFLMRLGPPGTEPGSLNLGTTETIRSQALLYPIRAAIIDI